MNKDLFTKITQVIQIIALVYLCMKVLNLIDGSKKLDSIERNVLKIKKQSDSIVVANLADRKHRDSVNQIVTRKLDSAMQSTIGSIKKINELDLKIGNLQKTYMDNKVILPNPDK